MKTNLIKTVLFVLVGIVIIGLAFLFATRYIYKSKASIGEIVLSLDPIVINGHLNREVDVSVIFTGNVGKLVSGATVAITYEKTFLTFLGSDSSAPCDGIDSQIRISDKDISPQPTGT